MPRTKKKAPSVNLQDPEALKNAGNECQLNGKFQEAIAWYTKAIELDSSNPVFFSNRAQAFVELKDYGKAIEDCETALMIDPKHVKSIFRRSQAMLKQSGAVAFDEALKQLDQCFESLTLGLEVDPENETFRSLQKDVEKERQLRALFEKVPEDSTAAANMSSLVNWIEEDSLESKKLSICHYAKDDRRVHANCDIEEGEILLFVPKKKIMTLDFIREETQLGKDFLKAGLDEKINQPNKQLFACFLLQESANPESKFKKHIDSLPTDFSSFPVFFTEEEKAWLKGSPTLQIIEHLQKAFQEDRDILSKELPQLADFKFSDKQMLINLMIVQSRMFQLMIGGESTEGLVPFADMLNHSEVRNVSYKFNDARQGFEIVARQDIKRGEEVCNNYGQRCCNSRYMLHYGFLLDDNDANMLNVQIKLIKSIPHYERKKGLLSHEHHTKELELVRNFENEHVQQFFSFLRFAEYSGDISLLQALWIDWDKKNPGEEFTAQRVPPIDIELELKVLTTLKKISQNSLANYPDSLEKDKEYLAAHKAELSTNVLNCLKLRIDEKELCQYFVDFVDFSIDLLSLEHKEAKQRIAKAPESLKPANYYFTNTVMSLLSK